MKYDGIKLHPKVKELLSRYDILKDELGRLIEEREYITVTEIPRLQSEYKFKVGIVEYDCFALKIQMRAMRHEIKMRQAALMSGEIITDEEIKSRIEVELKNWKKQIDQMNEEINEAKLYLNSPTLVEEEAREFKLLYRNIVKKLHPDINLDLSEDNKTLWSEVNKAYKDGNIEELRSLNERAENIEEDLHLEDENVLDNISNRIVEKRNAIEKVIEDINKLNSEFPVNMKEKLDDKEWIRIKNEDTTKQIEDLEKKKVFLKAMLAEFI
ncbi:molecular chaperone DnaJ [Clostridium pasteurianum]|uniref:DnaJ-class molecular chaperone with C-terminal Zn finger domain n=1 Tax=Clostridium pasteurianum BC1 TaxID=86416 RepID=R4K820_CLOPA|nr:molecular chaperone DnaJ [Clostridium pasteurianum]AGK98698.1 DnaJ-class molecular chaperone with C-terminal Zn finger domain [Clostridium pasteurianum BC1]